MSLPLLELEEEPAAPAAAKARQPRRLQSMRRPLPSVWKEKLAGLCSLRRGDQSSGYTDPGGWGKTAADGGFPYIALCAGGLLGAGADTAQSDGRGPAAPGGRAGPG